MPRGFFTPPVCWAPGLRRSPACWSPRNGATPTWRAFFPHCWWRGSWPASRSRRNGNIPPASRPKRPAAWRSCWAIPAGGRGRYWECCWRRLDLVAIGPFMWPDKDLAQSILSRMKPRSRFGHGKSQAGLRICRNHRRRNRPCCRLDRFARGSAANAPFFGVICAAFLIVPVTCYLPQTFGQLLCILPVFGFFTLCMHAGYAIYFPELFPTRLRATGASFVSISAGSWPRPCSFFSGLVENQMDLHLAITLFGCLFLLGLVGHSLHAGNQRPAAAGVTVSIKKPARKIRAGLEKQWPNSTSIPRRGIPSSHPDYSD